MAGNDRKKVPGLLLILLGTVISGTVLAGPVPAGTESVEETAEISSETHREMPTHRLYVASMTIVRHHPIGFDFGNRLMYSYRLSKSDHLLLRTAHVAIGPSFRINPVGMRVGPVLELQPVAFLHLRAGYEWLRYFGTLGHLQYYTAFTDDHSDAARRETHDEAVATPGHLVFAELMVQLKFGYFVVRSNTVLSFLDIRHPDNARFFYDPTFDTLLSHRGIFLTNDTDLVFLTRRAAAGLRYSAVVPVTGPRHQRMGPLLLWFFNDREYRRFNRPALFGIVAWYLEHENRLGAMPYLLIGFSFTSDLLIPRVSSDDQS